MAKASEQFRQSDVTTWGIVALVLAGIAVVGSNVSAVLPQGLLAGLHKTRIEGASMEQLRIQVSDLRAQAIDLKQNQDQLAVRLDIDQQQGTEVVRRVGALEVSLPNLLEARSTDDNVDRSNFTAGIGSETGLVYEADGGSVMVRQQPMPGIAVPTVQQALPAPLDTAAFDGGYGVAIGQSIAPDQADEAWRDLTIKLGPLLFGMAPVLAQESETDARRIVVGPMSALAEATALCTRLEQISVPCLPVPYSGTPLVY